MKRIMCLLLLLASLPAMATNNCNVTFDGGLHITDSAVEFSEGDELRYKIQGRKLWVNSRQLPLSNLQADEVEAYGKAIQALVPQGHQMAREITAMSADALVMVLQGFTGQESEASRKVQQQFSLLQADIDKSFQLTNGFHLGEGGKGNASFPSSAEFHRAFEGNLQKIVDEAGSDIAWQAMKMVGASIFSGDGAAGIDARMEAFAKQLEQSMEARAKKLEVQGLQLCTSLVALDQHENRLKATIPELRKYDFIAVTKDTASR
jgi:hypothetical protein